MPICTTCTRHVSYLYTVYESAYNLRLTQCPHCHEFADPYVEYDNLTVLLDLMLMKRGVYRHLLYNRGASPRLSVRDPTSTGQPVQGKRDKRVSKSIWVQVLSLGGPLILSDAISQWISFHGSEADANISSFVLTFLICAAETAAFHVGVIFACYVTVVGVNWRWCRLRVSDPLGAKVDQSAIRKEFRPSLIPLSLFYSTITKSFLLILLTIWHPSALSLSFMDKHVASNGFLGPMSYALSQLDLFDDDKVDRQWLVRNGLGGLSAGFGLQVILEADPLLTTIIILLGWAVKAVVSQSMRRWIRTGAAEQAWLVYSIP